MLCVVYLLIPTSNHNARFFAYVKCSVVYLLIPTSNHNYIIANKLKSKLYIF